MDTRLTATRRIWRSLIAASVAPALVMALGATSVSAASPTACRVQNTDTGRSYQALQAAVDAASTGDRLTISGVCHGLTIIDKGLMIEGRDHRRRGRPILDGEHRTRVLRIAPGAHVVIRALVASVSRVEVARRLRTTTEVDSAAVAPARGYRFRTGAGAGIYNRGSLTLRDVVVRRNCAVYGGGGIFNVGTLRVLGSSLITLNRMQGDDGGGIFNAGIATLAGSTAIRHNHMSGVRNTGTFTMNGSSSIRGHTGPGCCAAGGVDNVYRRAIFVMNDRSSIRGNGNEYAIAGGVFSFEGATLVMNDRSSIRGNRGEAGGVYSDFMTTLRLSGSSVIRDNHSSWEPPMAPGGIYADDTSTVLGVRCAPRRNANVFDNTPNECEIEKPSMTGAASLTAALLEPTMTPDQLP
jgi:hypothetical protein